MPSVRPNFFWLSKLYFWASKCFWQPNLFWPSKNILEIQINFGRPNYSFSHPKNFLGDEIILDRQKIWMTKNRFCMSQKIFGRPKLYLDSQNYLDGQNYVDDQKNDLDTHARAIWSPMPMPSARPKTFFLDQWTRFRPKYLIDFLCKHYRVEAFNISFQQNVSTYYWNFQCKLSI